MTGTERQELLSQLRRDADRIAGQFQLNYRAIHAEHANVKSRYGVCYADGLIKIRLNHARTGKALRYSSLIDTLCHELAHLRHFNHGPEFKAFFFELLNWSRREGIYRPRSSRPAAAPAEPTWASCQLKLPRRNGVAVFPPKVRSNPDATPWARRGSQATATARGSRRRPTAQPAPATESAAPPSSSAPATATRQLALFG